MENKKKIIIVISLVLVYFIIMMFVFGFDFLKKKVNYLEILIEPDTYIKYEKGQWKDVTDTKELLGKDYKIYDQYHFLYHGVLQYTNDKWYAFDGDNKPLTLPDNFFAYRGNIDLDIIPFEPTEMSDEDMKEATEILKEHNITFEPEYTKKEKIEIDLNNDGIKEIIYIISNVFGIEEQSVYFSIAYMKINGQNKILSQEILESLYQVPSFTLSEIIDVDKDKNYELILRKTYFDQIGTCHEILGYEKENYHSIKACKIIKRGDENE